MGFWEKVLGFRDFVKREEMKKEITKSKYYTTDENIDDVKSMIFFETKTQKTWLIATDIRLYCVLDDISKDTTNINWSDHIYKFYDKTNRKLLISLSFVNYKEKTGRINFGSNHKGWLYTKKLFKDQKDFEKRFEGLFQ